jgi:hypothetical protein
MCDFQVQYSITTAGTYSLQILFSGVVGAQSPIELMVQSAATDPARTYGYGTVKQSTAGVTSSIYVQTRDSFGNNVLIEPETNPSGSEDISFELCNSVKNDPSLACFGGIQELSVSVTLSYGIGPPGSSGTAYGLYRLSYFPFTDGVFTPLVRHNNTVVMCLFDTSELPEAEDPDAAEVDSCIQDADKGSSNLRRLPSIIHLMRSQPSGRMARGNIEMVVNTTFKEPDLHSARHFTFLAPILAAIIGVIFDFFYAVIIPELKTKYKKLREPAVAYAESSASSER